MYGYNRIYKTILMKNLSIKKTTRYTPKGLITSSSTLSNKLCVDAKSLDKFVNL